MVFHHKLNQICFLLYSIIISTPEFMHYQQFSSSHLKFEIVIFLLNSSPVTLYSNTDIFFEF